MSYSKLKGNTADFNQMMHKFGVVTVMDAKIYAIPTNYDFTKKDAKGICAEFEAKKGTELLATIDSLKIANVTIEGPNKTVTGGQYSNPLIKFGKSARIEMQDALGRADAVEAFGGVVNTYSDMGCTTIDGMHITEDFAPARLIIGTSFFIDQITGQQVKVKIIFYQVLPDSIFNLTQDAEGDATVFDMNGDLLTTNIKFPDVAGEGDGKTHGVFYSVIAEDSTEPIIKVTSNTYGAIDVKATKGELEYSINAGDSFAKAADASSTLNQVAVGNTIQFRSVLKGVELDRISVVVAEA